MIIDKKVLEAVIVFLYKLEEYEACDALLRAYKNLCEDERNLH